jgi:trigger factor
LLICSFTHSLIDPVEIVLEKSTDVNARLNIVLTPADYKPELDKKLKEYSRKVSLKGFRPGMVPPALVKKMYGKGLLIDEVNAILSKTVSEYIREQKLQVVGDPIPDRQQAEQVDWDNQEEFTFSYELGLASDFNVDFGHLPAVYQYEIGAADKEVDETIENLRNQFTGQIHADDIAEDDLVYGDLKQLTGAEDNLLATKTALPLKQMAPDALPQFIGKQKGDVITFDLVQAFPDEKARGLATGVRKEEAANLTGAFTFAVEDITRTAPGELNQEFFDKVLGIGAVDNEADFRAKVLDIIQNNYSREAANLVRYDIEKALLDTVPINLPDAFLKDWLLNTNEGKFTMEQIEEQYPDFTKSVKLQLIKNKVAENTDIKVEFAEVMEVTRQMVREQFGFGNSAESDTDHPEMDETIDKIARNYLMDEKNNGQNYTNTFNRVYDDKVTEYLKTQIELQPKLISVDEFKTLADAARS